jgi:hypothetical protein
VPPRRPRKPPAPEEAAWVPRNGLQPSHAGDTVGELAYVKLGTMPGATMVVERWPLEVDDLVRVRANIWGSQWIRGLVREVRGELVVMDRF